MVCVAATGPHTLFDAHLSLSQCVSGDGIELALHVQSHLILSM